MQQQCAPERLCVFEQLQKYATGAKRKWKEKKETATAVTDNEKCVKMQMWKKRGIQKTL